MLFNTMGVNVLIIASFISVLFTVIFTTSTSLIICLTEKNKGEQ